MEEIMFCSGAAEVLNLATKPAIEGGYDCEAWVYLSFETGEKITRVIEFFLSDLIDKTLRQIIEIKADAIAAKYL